MQASVTAGRTSQTPTSLCEALEHRVLFTTQLVADINPGADSSNPYSWFRSSAGDVYFAATRGSSRSLWKLDASSGQAVPFLPPSAGDGYAFGEIDGRVIVRSNGSGLASGYWSTGGSPDDVRPFAADLASDPSQLLFGELCVGSAVYIATYALPATGPHTARLWKATGTDGSLTLLLEYQVSFPLGQNDPLPAIQNLTNIDGQVRFAAKTEPDNWQVWKTDGTPAGTTLVGRVPGPAPARAPSTFVRSGANVFFRASGPVWKTDGTPQGTRPAGTAVIEDQAPIIPDGAGGVYFCGLSAANPAVGGLYRSNAAGQQTTVREFSAQAVGPTRAGATLYFSLISNILNNFQNLGMWASDGTSAGTRQLLTADNRFVYASNFGPIEFDGMLYFPGGLSASNLDSELWRTDGTPAGTVLVADIWPGPASSRPRFMWPLGDALYFQANDGVHGIEPWRTTSDSVKVIGRRVFYNHSAYDGRDPAANLADLSAVAPDKTALLPNQLPSFDNVTSYARGINGVLIDFAGVPPQTLTAADFTFRFRGGSPTASWAAAPPPASVTLLPSPVGANLARYALTWPDGAVRNGWLEVTVNAGPRTGLSAPDIFYFGNLVGATGYNDRVIDWDDVSATRAALGSPSALTGRLDFDRDGRVTILDLLIVRSATGHVLAGPFDRAAAPASAAPRVRPPTPKRSVYELAVDGPPGA
jgi:ELWxxDGT repeat protein